MEEFENSAAFSRDYQSSQKCMCDREHMYDCPGSTEENQLDSLARSIQNNGLSDQDIDQLVQNIQQDHKVVAKKFHSMKVRRPAFGSDRYLIAVLQKRVPEYLNGEKLPVLAKKSPQLSMG